jgi:hypothetical protein
MIMTLCKKFLTLFLQITRLQIARYAQTIQNGCYIQDGHENKIIAIPALKIEKPLGKTPTSNPPLPYCI